MYVYYYIYYYRCIFIITDDTDRTGDLHVEWITAQYGHETNPHSSVNIIFLPHYIVLKI